MTLPTLIRVDAMDEYVSLILKFKGNISVRANFEVIIEEEAVICSMQPIHLAVHAANLTGAKVLLNARASVESRATFDAVPGYTPVHLAAALCARAGDDSVMQHQVLKTLQDSKADPSAVDLSGSTYHDQKPASSSSSSQPTAPASCALRIGMPVLLDRNKIESTRAKLRLEVNSYLAKGPDAFRHEFKFVLMSRIMMMRGS
jgi:hypothetical protein